MPRSKAILDCGSVVEHGVAMKLEPGGVDPAPILQVIRRIFHARQPGVVATDIQLGQETILVVYVSDWQLFPGGVGEPEVDRRIILMMDWLFVGL